MPQPELESRATVLQYSKITGFWVIKKVKTRCDKTYLEELLKEVVWLRKSNEHAHLPVVSAPNNIAPIEKPNKEDAILNIKSRFKNNWYFIYLYFYLVFLFFLCFIWCEIVF